MGEMGEVIVQNFIGGEFIPIEINNTIPRYTIIGDYPFAKKYKICFLLDACLGVLANLLKSILIWLKEI